MVGSSSTAGLSRIVVGQFDWIFTPRFGGSGRRLVVLLHGQLQTGQEWNSASSPGQSRIARELAGFPMISIYASGVSWGNDAALANIETARAWASNLDCATDKILLVGASMGGLVALNYARANPTRVAALIGIMPACDLDDVRDNDRGGTGKANVNTAWGMPVGSDSGTDPLPSHANPNTVTNTDLIKSSGAPIELYYSTVDTIAVPSAVVSIASKLGITPTIISTTVDHSDTLFDGVPMDEVKDILRRKSF